MSIYYTICSGQKSLKILMVTALGFWKGNMPWRNCLYFFQQFFSKVWSPKNSHGLFFGSCCWCNRCGPTHWQSRGRSRYVINLNDMKRMQISFRSIEFLGNSELFPALAFFPKQCKRQMNFNFFKKSNTYLCIEITDKSIKKKGKERKEISQKPLSLKQLLKSQLLITAYSDQLNAALELA